MKPTLQSIQLIYRGEARASARKGASLPKTDYHYQAPFADFSRGSNGKGGPSFRGISATYFKTEARGHFAVEATIFGVIALTAGVPVIGALLTFWHSFV